MSDSRTVLEYHQRTKHHLHRQAASLGYMDWNTQPYPFRRFDGVPTVDLALTQDGPGQTYDQLFTPATGSAPLAHESLSRFLFHGLALSAWKEVVGPDGRVSSRWSLRVNPSSGNLHPTEGYLLVGEEAGLETGPGLYHYAPDDHVLEQRASGELALPAGGFLLGLTSIPWREAWKYGERAFRYCQHDVGHALAALSLSARMLGWELETMAGLPAGLAERVLGTDAQQGPEKEHADVLVWVRTGAGEKPATEKLEAWASGRKLVGLPNPLSSGHHEWPVIDEVAGACQGGVLSAVATGPFGDSRPGPQREAAARSIIRRRRSAVSMDGKTQMAREDFLALLGRLLPGRTPLPYAGLPGPAEISLVLFVHRVTGVAPGLYALLRNPDHEAPWRAAMRADFSWDAEGELPLFHLASGNCRELARQISCHQDIAADGAFSLGMVARCGDAVREHGPAWYPRLFWESGMIGQMLYLEAEAAGLRGTGIGCFFDDEVHRLLGLQGDAWQSLYHFTVGGPVDDARLRTAAPYAHLKR